MSTTRLIAMVAVVEDASFPIIESYPIDVETLSTFGRSRECKHLLESTNTYWRLPKYKGPIRESLCRSWTLREHHHKLYHELNGHYPYQVIAIWDIFRLRYSNLNRKFSLSILHWRFFIYRPVWFAWAPAMAYISWNRMGFFPQSHRVPVTNRRRIVEHVPFREANNYTLRAYSNKPFSVGIVYMM
jgi:hypothetical protein